MQLLLFNWQKHLPNHKCLTATGNVRRTGKELVQSVKSLFRRLAPLKG